MAAPTQTATTTSPQEPRWISIEEAEKLEKLLFKNYVPKDDEKFAKKFYYRVESIIPYTPADFSDPDKHRYHVMIQKYHRDKTEKVNTNDGSGNSQEIERNQRVDSHEMRNGKFVLIDAQANRLVDSDEFKKSFTLDTNAD